MKDSETIKSEFNAKRLDMEKYILVVFFLIQQRWGYIVGKELADDNITTKQWLMMIVLATAFQKPPSIQEVADAMSTTHQNVKQIADRLAKRGFLNIQRDPDNKRILRLKVTPECVNYWKKRDPKDIKAVKSLFEGLDDLEIQQLFEIFSKLEKISGEMYNKAKNR